MPVRHNTVFRHKKRRSSSTHSTRPTSSTNADNCGVAVGSVPASLLISTDVQYASRVSSDVVAWVSSQQQASHAYTTKPPKATTSRTSAPSKPPKKVRFTTSPSPELDSDPDSHLLPADPAVSPNQAIHTTFPSHLHPSPLWTPPSPPPRLRSFLPPRAPFPNEHTHQPYLPQPSPHALPRYQTRPPDAEEHGTVVQVGGFGEAPVAQVSVREQEEIEEMRKIRSHEDFLAALEEVRWQVKEIRRRNGEDQEEHEEEKEKEEDEKMRER